MGWCSFSNVNFIGQARMEEQEGGAEKRLGRDGQQNKKETVQGKRARERQRAKIKKLNTFFLKTIVPTLRYLTNINELTMRK